LIKNIESFPSQNLLKLVLKGYHIIETEEIWITGRASNSRLARALDSWYV